MGWTIADLRDELRRYEAALVHFGGNAAARIECKRTIGMSSMSRPAERSLRIERVPSRRTSA